MSMTTQYDAIIVGAGHNGLTCGAYLAKAGLKTLVLERRHVIGGAAVTEEFSPGFRASIFSYIMGHVNPKVIADLELEKFGLEHMKVEDVIYPLYDNDCIVFTSNLERNLQQIARFSKKDAEAYPEFFNYMSNSIRVMRNWLLETPVDPADRSWRKFKETAGMIWRYRKIGDELYRIYDAMTMSAYEYVSQWFESDVVKAVLCYWATIGCNVGPKSPGTAFNILFHLVGENGMGFCRGGMGMISQSLADSGRRHGMEIKTDSPVNEILVENGRAAGVITEDGREYRGKLVSCNVSASLTFGKLVRREHLPESFMREIKQFRNKGSAFKINLAVDQAPQYKGFDPVVAGVDYPAYAHIGPTTEYLERAADDAKYGWYSAKPFISPIVPSMIDDSLAPEGKHVVTLYGGHAPCELKGANWDDERDNFVRNVMDVMDEFAPGFSSSIIDMQVLLPPDIEHILGIPGGHELHGEVALDQLFFMRPASKYADYRSPVRGLYQCGASTHPGGAVSAVPGHNAAREILKDWKEIRK
ncbi:MAG: NAD(P)/FAD-dependent oxidoreductase [Gammaproteobacteria bacterium]|nr:NAD(P)/FAD-dependent oxidoreductase [Gammaproteobacteria bacterium]